MKKYLLIKVLSIISSFGIMFSNIAASEGCLFLFYEPEMPDSMSNKKN